MPSNGSGKSPRTITDMATGKASPCTKTLGSSSRTVSPINRW